MNKAGLKIPPIPADVAEVDLVTTINDRLRRIVQAQSHDASSGSSTSSGGQLTLCVPGTLGIRSSAAPLISLGSAVTPSAIVALLKQPPSGGALALQVNAAGQSYATLTIAAGAASGQASGSLGTIPANTVVTLDITGVGLTFPGSDLTVEVRF